MEMHLELFGRTPRSSRTGQGPSPAWPGHHTTCALPQGGMTALQQSIVWRPEPQANPQLPHPMLVGRRGALPRLPSLVLERVA